MTKHAIKRVGFTGTRQGMSARQRSRFHKLLWLSGATHFHHGGCVGADIDAHRIAKGLRLTVEVHPCTLAGQQGNFSSADVVHPTKPPLERNRDIVDAVGRMFACPRTPTEELRSGTWATIRYARRRCRQLTILKP